MWNTLLIPILIALIAAVLLLVARWLLLRALRAWARGQSPALDRIFLSMLRSVSVFWCLALALYAGVVFSRMPDRYAFAIDRAIFVLILLSVTVALAGLAGRLFKYWVEKHAIPVPATGLTYGLIIGTVYVLGGLMVLHALGVSITPLLTALGLGGLALALAIKDTLANLFAGIQIILEKPFVVGDFINIQPGQEGFVTDIGLRTTKLRVPSNNLIIVPNTLLTQNVITNFNLPGRNISLKLPVIVSYKADPAAVRNAIYRVALQGTLEIPGLLKEPPPSVLLTGFNESRY
jgi:small-conductance mechanosensitive channel